VQGDPCEERQDQVEIGAKGAGDQQERKQAGQGGHVADVAQPLPDQDDGSFGLTRRPGSAPDRIQGRHHPEVAGRVEPETRRDPERRDDQPADRRADDSGQVEGGGVEGHRARQLAAPNHLQDGCLAGREIQGLVDPEHPGDQQQDRQRDEMGHGEDRVQRGADGRDDLGDEQDISMDEPIHQGAGIEAEHQDRAIAEGAEQREREGRVVRELQDKPGGGDRLHPGADNRDRLADVVAAKLSVLKGRRLQQAAIARTRWGKQRGANVSSLRGPTPPASHR